jgi:predicted nucleotidyltransferase
MYVKQSMKSKWHNISIQTKSFEELRGIQKLLPIRASIPQVIEWLIKVGQAQIIQTKSETNGKLQIRVTDLEDKFRKAGM